WFVNDEVLDALVELGFVYDCSAQFPRPKTSGPVPNNRWLRAPQYYSNSHGRVLCLPTTCSLGEWFKWGRKARRESDQFYQIVYFLQPPGGKPFTRGIPLWSLAAVTGIWPSFSFTRVSITEDWIYLQGWSLWRNGDSRRRS